MVSDNRKKNTTKSSSNTKKTTKKSATKKKKAKKKTTRSVVKKPKVIDNRFVFRDQLNANNCDLLGEILKNISKLPSIEKQIEYQMDLLPYAYNKLGMIQFIEHKDPLKKKNDEEYATRTEYIEGEVIPSSEDNKGEFDEMLKNI